MLNKERTERKAVSTFIWDLDGTLMDSYPVIVHSLHKTFEQFHVSLQKEMILNEVISASIGAFISKMAKETGIGADTLSRVYTEISEKENFRIRPMKNVPETLRFLADRKIPSYVFTHRGASTGFILKNTGLTDLFEDIVTGKDGFARKPDPGAIIYLIRKHGLDREGTAYVGDRTIDVECAVNAGIRSILYHPENSVAKVSGKETWVVRDMAELQALV